MILAKVLAVVAAVFLVGAVAVATLGEPGMSLGEALAMIDAVLLMKAESFVRLHLSGWIWDRPFKALLERPVWLLPGAIGLILAGAAMTMANNGDPLNSRQRRR